LGGANGQDKPPAGGGQPVQHGNNSQAMISSSKIFKKTLKGAGTARDEFKLFEKSVKWFLPKNQG